MSGTNKSNDLNHLFCLPDLNSRNIPGFYEYLDPQNSFNVPPYLRELFNSQNNSAYKASPEARLDNKEFMVEQPPKNQFSTTPVGRKTSDGKLPNPNVGFSNYYASDDIMWMERVDQMSMNFSGFVFCPICGSLIENRKQNLGTISSLFSKSKGKYFLIHNECFKKSLSLNDIPKVKRYFNEYQCILNFQPKFQPQDIINYKINSNKKFYSLVWEFYHPVSSLLYFKIDKVLPVLDCQNNGNSILYWNMLNNLASLFEPNFIIIPYLEFKCAITLFSTDSNEELHSFEFAVDLTATGDFNQKFDIVYKENGNNFSVGAQLVDANSEIIDHMNFKTNYSLMKNVYYSGFSPASFPPGFTSTVKKPPQLNYLLLHYLIVNLPLQKSIKPEFTKPAFISQELAATLYPLHMGFKHHSEEEITNLEKNTNYKAISIQQNILPNQPPKFIQGAPTNVVLTDFKQLGKSPLIKQEMMGQSLNSPYPDEKKKSKLNINSPNFENKSYENKLLNKSSMGRMGRNLGDEIQSAGIYTQYSQRKKKIAPVDTKNRTTDDFCDFNEIENDNSFIEENLNVIQEEEKTLNSFEEDIKQIEEDLRLAGYGENIELFDINKLKGKIVSISKTNHGSRIMQKIIGKIDHNDLQIIISEIQNVIPELMLDSYGNYMVQSLVNVCTVDQRFVILEKIAPKISEISKDKKGTHSLQTFVSLINLDREIILTINSIDKKISELSMDNNATHFIQKIIVCFDEKYLGSVFVEVTNNIVAFGNHACGLCVLKCLMNKLKDNYQKSDVFISLLTINNDVLIQNPFGNYAIQHAFELYGYERCQEIANRILMKMIQFTSQKFSSNVVEKLVSKYRNHFIKKLVNELVKSDMIKEFMKNKYGSLILTKVLQVVDVNDYKTLIELIKVNIVNVHAANFKTKWQSFLDKSMERVFFTPLPLSATLRQGPEYDTNKTKTFKKTHNLNLNTASKQPEFDQFF